MRRGSYLKLGFKAWIAVASVSTARAQTPPAAGPSAPPAQAVTCVACHGEAGISPNDLWPNIAGQKQGYLKLTITAYRDGGRRDPLMTPIAQMLSDSDIDVLAKHYSELR